MIIYIHYEIVTAISPSSPYKIVTVLLAIFPMLYIISLYFTYFATGILCFIFNIVLALQGLLTFSVNLRTRFFIPAKRQLESWQGLYWTGRLIWGSTIILTILDIPFYKHGYHFNSSLLSFLSMVFCFSMSHPLLSLHLFLSILFFLILL